MEVLGTCCGKPGTGDCGGYSGGKSALEHYKDGLFDDPKVTTWKSEYIIAISVGPTHFYAGGSNEEVYWIGNGYHRGDTPTDFVGWMRVSFGESQRNASKEDILISQVKKQITRLAFDKDKPKNLVFRLLLCIWLPTGQLIFSQTL